MAIVRQILKHPEKDKFARVVTIEMDRAIKLMTKISILSDKNVVSIPFHDAHDGKRH